MDRRLRQLERRAAASGDPEDLRRLEAERARLGIVQEPDDSDPDWRALLLVLGHGPATLFVRDTKQEHLDRLSRERQAWVTRIGSRVVVGLPETGRTRYDDELQAARVRSARARRAAATRRRDRIEAGTWPPPKPVWKRPRKIFRLALHRIAGDLSRSGGVNSYRLNELLALTRLNEDDLLRLLSALEDGRINGWTLTAAKFGDEFGDEEWTLTVGA